MGLYYVTTPIYYVNAEPHAGSAYTTVYADALARYHRLIGDRTFFLTGTDEHGQNILKVANEKGINPQEFVDQMAQKFKDAWRFMRISNDDFIRTTEPRHEKVVQRVIEIMYEKGDIYLGTYQGWYCPKCETYYGENELENGNCPIHKTPVEFVSEESYFFKWSKYQDPLLELYRNNEEYLHAVQFPDYWKPIPPDAPLEFKFIGTTETATVRTLMTKRELEISDFRQPAEFYKNIAKLPGIKVAKLFGGSTFYCMMHNRKPPTDDIHFRKALAYCIDYDAIANQIFPGARQAQGPVSFILPGHNPEVYQYKRDLEKAREELKKSKYYDQLDQYPVDLIWCAEVPDEEKVALLIQANAAEIGIKVNVVKTPWMKIIDEVATPESTAHMYLIFVSPHYAEAGSMLQSKYHSSSCGTWEQTEWLQDPELDRMIEDAIATVDHEERFAKYRKIQEYIVDLCPSLFLIDQPENYAYQDYYIDWVAAERAERGEKVNPVMGYNHYMLDVKVYPEKRDELLKK